MGFDNKKRRGERDPPRARARLLRCYDEFTSASTCCITLTPLILCLSAAPLPYLSLEPYTTT